MYQYLNQDNQWPRVRRFGLEVDADSGALSLRKLPGPPRPIARAPGEPAKEPTAAGIAVGRDGSISLSYPDLHQVFRVDTSGGVARPLRCIESLDPPIRQGSDLRLMSWGDGSGVPTSGNNLVIVGADGTGLLHIRIFDAGGNRVTDTDETKLTTAPAGAIPTLTGKLPGLLPPHVLTGAEKAQVITGVTSIVGQTPRGLAFQQCRNRLLIADTLNSRIQVVDGVQERVVAIWGQTWPYQTPRPCGEYGGLNGPEQLACDRPGNVYVIDRLANSPARVVKLTRDGEVERTFDCSTVDPVHIAVGQWRLPADEKHHESVFVLALDRALNVLRLFVFDPDGKLLLKDPLKLIGPDLPKTTGAPSVVTFGLSPSLPAGKGNAANPSGPVTAFNVIGTTAVVALATARSRVWCFDLADLMNSGDPGAVESSWLPLYDGPAVALGVRGEPDKPHAPADLLLFAGPGLDLLALAHRGAYRKQGAFLAGPFTGNRDLATQWHRIRFDGTLSDNGHVQWFTLSRASAPHPWSAPPRPRADRLPSWYRVETQPDLFAKLQFAPNSEAVDAPEPDEFHPVRRPGSWAASLTQDRTPPGQWFAFEENQFDGLVRNDGGTPNQPADQLWVFGLIAADGKDSPVFHQARLENDVDGWLLDLPEVYQRGRASRALVRAVLALLESRFEDVDEIIDQLPALFSPHAMVARYGRQSPEVDWLRAVLALPTQPRLRNTEDDRKRNTKMFAEGPYWLARRGTPEGLRRLVWLATGVDLVIEEPGLYDLPQVVGQPDLTETESPGIDPQDGIGNENILGYSALPDPDDPRPRLPDDLANHFVVRGYESDLIDPDLRQLVEQVVRQSAPSHMTYSIQVIEPRARLGIQARLGIDAVVAPRHPADPFTLDAQPGPDAQLDPRPLPPTVGAAHLNRHTPLL